MLGRVDHVDASCEHRDRSRLHRSGVRFAIDTARHAGDDHIARLAQLFRQIARHAAADRRSVARASHGDGGAVQQVAPTAHADQRRRCVDGGKAGGIVRLARRAVNSAQLLTRSDLPFGFVAGRRTNIGLGAGLLQ